MCVKNENQAAIDAANHRNLAAKYKWGSEKAMFHNKETQYMRGKNAAVIEYTRTRSNALENAFTVAGKGRLMKQSLTKQYAQAADTKARYRTGEAGSRTAGRNNYLKLLDKFSEVEYAIDQTWSKGMDKAELGAIRQKRSRDNKLFTALGVPKQPPLLEPVPKGQKNWMKAATTVASLALAVPTGGASLSALGIGGLGKGEDQYNPFG